MTPAHAASPPVAQLVERIPDNGPLPVARSLHDILGTTPVRAESYWADLAARRDAKIGPTYRPELPHERCRRRRVRLLLMGHHACPPCAAAKVRWMNAWNQRSFLRATAERFIRDYRLCATCYYPLATCRHGKCL